MKKKKYFYIGLAAIMFIGIVGVWFKFGGMKFKKTETEIVSQNARPVCTAVVKKTSRSAIRIFPGKTRASRRVKLAFSVPGLLQELNVREGHSVKKGDILAKLDQRDYLQKYEVAKAKYYEEKNALKRIKLLCRKKIACESNYEKALAEYDIAKAELLMSKKALEDTVLRAPFDGVVGKKYVENYEHVEDKTPILLVQDISYIEVVIEVPKPLIAQFGLIGLKRVQVHFDVENYCWLDASVKELVIQPDSESRTYDVVVGLRPPKELLILPGMTASVKFETEEKKAGNSGEIALVPPEAVLSCGNGKSYVWKIPPHGGRPRKQQVTLGKMRNDGIEIFSGVFPGEHVAVSGIHSLNAKYPVRPMRKGKWGLDG